MLDVDTQTMLMDYAPMARTQLYLRFSRARNPYTCTACKSAIKRGEGYYRDEPHPMARKLRGEQVRYFCTLCIDGPEISDGHRKEAEIELILPDLWIPPSTQHIQLIKHETERIFETIRKTRALSELEPRQLEYLLAETLHREGFDIWVTPETRDHGRDVIAYRNGMLPLLVVGEAKKMDIVDPVWLRSLCCVCDRDRANLGILATTGRFSEDTWEEAEEWRRRIDLKDGDGFLSWIDSVETKRLQILDTKPT